MTAPKKPGPKTEAPVKPTSVTLDELCKRKLAVLGAGNTSAGIRVAADIAYDVMQGNRPTLPDHLK